MVEEGGGGLLCIQLSPSVSVPLLFYNSCSQTSGEAAPADTRLHKQSSSCVLSPCLTRSECFTGRGLGLGAPALMAPTEVCSYKRHYLTSRRLLKLSYLIIQMSESPKEAADIQPRTAAGSLRFEVWNLAHPFCRATSSSVFSGP